MPSQPRHALLAVLLAACGAHTAREPDHSPILSDNDPVRSEAACAAVVASEAGHTERKPACAELGAIKTEDLAKALREALALGNHCRALRLAEDFVAIQPAAIVLAVLAEEQAAVGMQEEALAGATRCLHLAAQQGHEPARSRCDALVRTLDRERANITVVGPPPYQGLRLFLDGTWRDGTDRSRDVFAGVHFVAVYIPDQMCCRRHLEVAAGDHIEIEIERTDRAPRDCRVLEVIP